MEVETERLLMRQWRQEDFEAYAEYYSNPETARYVGGQMSRPIAWRHMAAIVGHWVLRGFGIWAVEEKSTGQFAGGVGLWKPEGWPELEVGYWLIDSAQGKGLASEATIRARQYAYEELGNQTLVSYIDPANEPSIRLAKKVGAWHDETIELLNLGPHCVFRHPSPQDLNK